MKNQIKHQSFPTKRAVLDYLASRPELASSQDGSWFYPAGTYYLAHGEYSQPDYRPRRYTDGWGIYVTFYYYAGTFNAPNDGRTSLDR